MDRRLAAETEGEITPIRVFLSRSAGDGFVKVLRFVFGTGLAAEADEVCGRRPRRRGDYQSPGCR